LEYVWQLNPWNFDGGLHDVGVFVMLTNCDHLFFLWTFFGCDGYVDGDSILIHSGIELEGFWVNWVFAYWWQFRIAGQLDFSSELLC